MAPKGEANRMTIFLTITSISGNKRKVDGPKVMVRVSLPRGRVGVAVSRPRLAR